MRESFDKWFDQQNMILANADLAYKVWEAAQRDAFEKAAHVLDHTCEWEGCPDKKLANKIRELGK